MITLVALLSLACQDAIEPSNQRSVLQGRLLDADENPVDDRSIALLQGESSLLFIDVVDEVLTDGQGRFQLTGEPEISAVLRIDLDGIPHFRVVQVTALGETVDLGDIVLPRIYRLSGTIKDGANQPIEGVRVRALTPYLGGYFSMANWYVMPQLSARAFEVTADDLWVRGRSGRWAVLDSEAAHWRLLQDLPLPTTRTDDQGHYNLRILGPYGSILLADKGGYVGAAEPVGIEPDHPPDEKIVIDVAFDQGRSQSITLTRQQNAVAGAKVWVGSLHERTSQGGEAVARWIGTTDENGQIVATGLPEEDFGLVVVVELAPERRWAFHLPAGSSVLALPELCDLTVSVVDQEGQPITDPTIRVTPAEAALHGEWSTPEATNTSSTIISAVPRNVLGISVSAAGYESRSTEVDLRTPSLDRDRPIRVVLRPAQSVKLRVVNASSGEPCRGAVLYYDDSDSEIGRCNDSGEAELLTDSEIVRRSLEANRLNVTIRHPELIESIADVSALIESPGEVVEILVPGSQELEGRVLMHGKPSSEPNLIEIYVDHDGTNEEPVRIARTSRWARVDEMGQFRITGLPPGRLRYDLRPQTATLGVFEVPFYGPNDPPSNFSGEIDVGGGGVTLAALDATPMSERRGLVVEGTIQVSGLSPEGLRVEANTSGGEVVAHTDAKGQFRFDDLEGGEVHLEVGRSTETTFSRLATRSLTVASESKSTVDLQVNPMPVALAPKYDDGEPAWYHYVAVTRSEAPHTTAAWGNVADNGQAPFWITDTKEFYVKVSDFDKGMGGCVLRPPLPDKPIAVPMLRCVPCAGTIDFVGAPPEGDHWEVIFLLREATIPNVRGSGAGDCHVLVSATKRKFIAANIVPGIYTARLNAARWQTYWARPFRVDAIGDTDLKITFEKR